MADIDGTPIWFELAGPDAAAAAPFYARVADWRVAPSPNPDHGGYLIAGPDERTGVAGLMTAPPGMPPGWTIYFAADEVDAAADRVAALGGAIHAGPIDIPDVGRCFLVADPQGCRFTLMSGTGERRPTAFVAAAPGSDASIGHGCWTELRTSDPDAAFAFYGALFGWARDGAMPMGPMGDYAFIRHAGGQIGAIMSSTLTGAPAGWNWYVHVADIDAALNEVRAGGGSVRQGPDEIPGGSFSANIADPQGFGLGLVGARR